jgi:DNA polymerase-4
MDAFYAAVEQRDDPSLRGRPVVVGGDVRRGVVTSASYEARRFGIRSAMPMAEAVRRCPDVRRVPGRMAHYTEIGRTIREIFHRFTPLVEPLSLDEAFLDVTATRGLFGSPAAIAEQVRRAIRDVTALTASAGVAPCKFVAKIASALAKPDGVRIVEPFAVEAFLRDLPVRHVWGVGRVSEASLLRLGIRTIGELAAADVRELERRFGRGAATLVALARGVDPRPVCPQRVPKSIGEEQTFPRDLPRERVATHLLSHTESLARRLRAAGLRAGAITLKLKLARPLGGGQFQTVSKRRSLGEPTADEEVIYEAAVALLEGLAVRLGTTPVRLAGVAAENLVANDPEQLLLFPAARERRRRRDALARAVDALARRYGPSIVRRARTES